jgi:hypothetical protein
MQTSSPHEKKLHAGIGRRDTHHILLLIVTLRLTFTTTCAYMSSYSTATPQALSLVYLNTNGAFSPFLENFTAVLMCDMSAGEHAQFFVSSTNN